GGKKKGKKTAPERVVVTTRFIEAERLRCMCPRLGDAYARSEAVLDVRADVVFSRLRKVVQYGLETLDASGGRLGFLPEEIRERPEMACLTNLNLSRNQLFNSDHVFGILLGLKNLKKLDLTDNFFNGVLSAAAGRLRELEELRLDVNQITELPAAVDMWTELRVFSISHNALTVLPPQASGHWRNLEDLNVRNNDLRMLPLEMGRWAKLRRLLAGGNGILEVPAEVGECSELEVLDLRGNALSKLPPELARCTSLALLHVGGNRISEFGPEMCEAFVNLQELYLYRNKITSLPPEVVGCMARLVKLSLSGNNIKAKPRPTYLYTQAIPAEIGACSGLAELYINNNQKFSSVPTSISGLKMLRELSARRCKALKSLPSELAKCENLKELDVRSDKKQTCRMTPEFAAALKVRRCNIRGGVIKKGKGKKA
ncbi:unnamed protein product, partial [Ectocarpus sp. 12 AP-2014]